MENQEVQEPEDGENEVPAERPGLRKDLGVLMKVRLNFFVLVTTFFGYLLASAGKDLDWWGLVHTLVGTAAVAFGSAAFNQLMEVDLDARMKRTADRPLPARRMDPLFAFGIGWVLSAAGIIHLAVQVGDLAAYLTAATLAIYVFIYTPMKRVSSVNTLIGAVPGAIPPVIGWVGAGGGLDWGAWFLFGLLFFWQLPHFVAINWLCREEYESVGYRMWSNGDGSGRKSAILAAVFSLALGVVSMMPVMMDAVGLVWAVFGPLLALFMMALALRFARDGERSSFRGLFLFTLLYLPVALLLLVISWKA